MQTLEVLVKQHYQALHAMPEPAFQELKTAAYLAEKLQELGYAVQTGVGVTGVVGILDSGIPGPVIGLRADMDCLLHLIDGKETAIHSCGHDAHCAMALTVCTLIAQNKPLMGKFKIIFQPAEESLQGAVALYEAGVIDELDYLLGVHLRTKSQAALGQATAAIYFGSSSVVEAVITGKTAHGARPQLGINAIDAVGAIIYGINAIHLDPLAGWSVKSTRINAGSSANAICDHAVMTFDLRAQKNEDMQLLLSKVTATIKNAASIVGAHAEPKLISLVPGAVYYPPLVELAANCIVRELGVANLLLPEITSGGEDFHIYVHKKPELKTAYIGIGCDLLPGLHDPHMHFEQKALVTGVRILEDIVRSIYKQLP